MARRKSKFLVGMGCRVALGWKGSCSSFFHNGLLVTSSTPKLIKDQLFSANIISNACRELKYSSGWLLYTYIKIYIWMTTFQMASIHIHIRMDSSTPYTDLCLIPIKHNGACISDEVSLDTNGKPV